MERFRERPAAPASSLAHREAPVQGKLLAEFQLGQQSSHLEGLTRGGRCSAKTMVSTKNLTRVTCWTEALAKGLSLQARFENLGGRLGKYLSAGSKAGDAGLETRDWTLIQGHKQRQAPSTIRDPVIEQKREGDQARLRKDT